MHETTDDLTNLQQLLDDSVERATPFLRRSFEMPDRSLSAQRLAEQLQGSLTVALATVTARGEPRVAPINALFYRGTFHIPTVAESARARHLAKRPAAIVTAGVAQELGARRGQAVGSVEPAALAGAGVV